jgi:hypothetical protein
MFIGDEQRRKAMTPTLTPPAGNLAGTAADERCDRCNAAGKLRLTLAGGGELVFCGHHANRYAEDLVKIAVQYAADPEFSWRGADMMSNSN